LGYLCCSTSNAKGGSKGHLGFVAVADIAKVGDTTGVVFSIDLLSVKLRTFDKRYIRIPNETLIKTEMTNVTRFPIRRSDINVGVAYKGDIGRVIEVLGDIADKTPCCLDEPEPFIMFMNFRDSAPGIRFGKLDDTGETLGLSPSFGWRI
jgi:small-conductance mechanosensitive channel